MADLIIGVGNIARGDDALGFRLVDLLRDQVSPSVRLEKYDGDAMGLLWLWNGADRVFIVDAMVTGQEPGTIHWISTDGLPRTVAPQTFVSGHRLGATVAVDLARVLELLPPHLVLCGIEGSDFTCGAGLSKPVQLAMGPLQERIIVALRPPS